MTKDIYFNLFIGNHASSGGIQEYIVLISKLIKGCSMPIKVPITLDSSAVNLIIDEFASYVGNRRISDFKKIIPTARSLSF